MSKQKTIPRSQWKKCECGRDIMSITGRTKCRECHRKTAVWARPNAQRLNQCQGFAIAPVHRKKFMEMTAEEAGDHVISLLGRCDILGVSSAVKRYIPGTPEFDEIARLYV